MTEIERLAKELVKLIEGHVLTSNCPDFSDVMRLTDLKNHQDYDALKKALYPKPTRQDIIKELQLYCEWRKDIIGNSRCPVDASSMLSNAIKELEKPVLEWVDYDPDVVPDCKWILIKHKQGHYTGGQVSTLPWSACDCIKQYAIIE